MDLQLGAAEFVMLEEDLAETDVSLISGHISRVGLGRSEDGICSNSCGDMSDRDDNRSILPIGSDFLRKRGWVGLEPHVGENPIVRAHSGRRGLASNYGEGEAVDNENGIRSKPDGKE